MAAKQQSDSNVGKVIEIKGVVLDVVFPGQLPEINNALELRGQSAVYWQLPYA